MTKSELIARLAENYTQLVAKDAEFAVKTILDEMANALARGPAHRNPWFRQFFSECPPAPRWPQPEIG